MDDFVCVCFSIVDRISAINVNSFGNQKKSINVKINSKWLKNKMMAKSLSSRYK